MCGGAGAVFECGCADIPSGDCDCNGNQLDALACVAAIALRSGRRRGVRRRGRLRGSYDACGVCTALARCWSAVVRRLKTESATATATLWTRWAFVVAIAPKTPTARVCDDEDDCVGAFDACGVCNGPGEIYECGCTDIAAGACDCEGNELDALGVCGGGCAADANGNGICDDAEVLGCTDGTACNYDSSANVEDGSCEYCPALRTPPRCTRWWWSPRQACSKM